MGNGEITQTKHNKKGEAHYTDEVLAPGLVMKLKFSN